MKWFDFKDATFVTFFIVMITLLILIGLLILTFALVNKSIKNYKASITNECYTIRVYSINVKTNKVLYFDRSDLKHKHQTDMSEFYEKFHPYDVEKVKTWIFSICVDSKNADQYLEADVLVKNHKVPAFSLLKLIKYDPAVGVLHIESHLLRYITPTHYVAKKKNKDLIQGVVKRGVIESYISKNKSLKGFTFAIRFIYNKQKALVIDKIERFMIMTLKNEIYPFLTESKTPRQIVEISNNELILFDLRISYKDEAIQLANSIANALKKSIGVNGFSNSVTFSIGVVENSLFYQNCQDIIEHAQEAAILGYQNQQLVTVYQKHSRNRDDIITYRQRIVDLIRNKDLRFLFRPIIDASTGKLFGYFQYTRAYNAPYTSYIELSKLAEKNKESKLLLAYTSKQILPKFVSEKPSETNRLFFHISITDIDNLIEIFHQIPAVKELTITIMFHEQEVSLISYDPETLKGYINKLKAEGYELALSLKDRDLLLDPNVYYEFDYFVCGANMIGEIKKNNRVRLSIHNLIEQLLKYKKPIIATDLEGWQPIELIIKSGISLVSSETILNSNDMILPLDKKKIEKLKLMDQNYR